MTLVGQIDALAGRVGLEIKTVRTEMSGKANAVHGHAIADVTGLQSALNGKAATGHGHAIADVTGLQSALDAKLALTGGTLSDAANIALGTSSGTKIGTATTQKLGFFNATPVVQPSATVDLGTALSSMGLRAAGTAYPLTTSGTVTLSGALNVTGTITTSRARVVSSAALTGAVTLATTSAEFQTADATSAAFTITLPSTSTPGYTFTIKKVDSSANAVTIAGTIDGVSAGYTLAAQNETVTLMSTSVSGTWRVAGALRSAATVISTSIADSTTVGRAVLTAVDAATARSAIGAGTSNLAIGTTSTTAKAGDYAPAWNDVTDKPASFTPATHAHGAADISSGVLNIARIPTGTTGTTVALGNDARFTDARTPTAHAHAGEDITSGTVAFARLPVGTAAGTVAAGNDSRLSDARTPTAHTHLASDITDSTTVGRAVLTAGDAAGARSAIGAGTSSLVIGTAAGTAKVGNYVPSWGEITSRPSTFPPDTHTHAAADITSGSFDVARLPVGTAAGTVAAGNDSRFAVASTAVQPARQVIAGTGLTGGGDLSADRTLAVAYGTAAGTAAQGNDSRITGAVPNTRTITAGTGLTGGGDLTANRTLAVSYGTSAGTAAQGNDSRLSDARTPLAHVHSATDITSGQLDRARLYTGSMLATVNGTPTNTDVWYGTQSQYDAISTKDANTEYNIYAT